MLAKDEGCASIAESASAWLLIFLVAGFMLYGVTVQPSEPQPTILSLADVSKDQLQLIPHIGPVLAHELKNLQGHDLKSCRGIGASREQTLRRYITTPKTTIP